MKAYRELTRAQQKWLEHKDPAKDTRSAKERCEMEHMKEVYTIKSLAKERDTLKEALRLACEAKKDECPYTAKECTYSRNGMCSESMGATCWRDYFVEQAQAFGKSLTKEAAATLSNCKTCGNPIHTNNNYCEECRREG